MTLQAPYPTIPPPSELPPSEAPPSQLPPWQAPPQPKGRGRRWTIAIIAVVVAVIAAVVAVLLTRGSSKESTTPPPTPTTPIGLHLLSVTSTSASFGWQAAAGTTPSSYYIYRDHLRIGSVAGSVHAYTDKSIKPSSAYLYQVSALVSGKESGLTPGLSVRTKAAALADAALTGTYDVSIKVTSESGYTHVAPGDTESWTWFLSKSGSKVRLDGDSFGGSWTMMLTQNGRTYTGQTVEAISTCNVTPVNTTIKATIVIDKASAASGQWVVTKFHGTFSQVAPYTVSAPYVCSGASAAGNTTGARSSGGTAAGGTQRSATGGETTAMRVESVAAMGRLLG